jgi:hypothetical protein
LHRDFWKSVTNASTRMYQRPAKGMGTSPDRVSVFGGHPTADDLRAAREVFRQSIDDGIAATAHPYIVARPEDAASMAAAMTESE